MSRRGKALLDRVPDCPPGLEDLVQFPLIEALWGRRARRFSLGASIPDGPLAFTSPHDPMPLSQLEQMLVLTAVAGNTGWQFLIPHNPKYLPKIPNYAMAAGGRTFPSAAGFHSSEFFFTDDQGVYFLPTRDAPSLLQVEPGGRVDLQGYLAAHRKRIKRLSEKRLHIPASPAHIEMHNPWCVNRPGSTLVIPVGDLSLHHLGALCYLVQNGFCIFDDLNDRPIPGIDRFGGLVDVANPLPLTVAEQLSLEELTVELATACYAGMLMLQAIGLGGWMFDGISPLSVLGASGDPEVPGLGFRFDTDQRWSVPNVTGLAGVFEGHCPPHYPDMRAAVEAVFRRKFGPGGPFHPDTPGPYRDTPQVRSSAAGHDDEFQDCVTLMAEYVFKEFGKFPGTVPTMLVLMYLQAHHLELDFYDKHCGPGAYLETHARHMERWHPQTASGAGERQGGG
ncbi:MAG: hypothetical protein ACOY3P_23210 [Planctomycetota bacterium]